MFIVLALAFFAIAGIAIDVGMASLTQQEMQVAVDPAAMEGVRLRDYNVYQWLSDQRRRPKVTNLVRLEFDDDLHPTLGTAETPITTAVSPDDEDGLHLGAGPLLRVTNPGDGALAPGGVLTIGDYPTGTTTPVWDDPILQGNQFPDGGVRNYEHGDMVSGTYVDGQPNVEDSQYHRQDFRRADPEALPQGSNWKALSFLVRMRRTTGANNLDDSPGKASRGPTVPFIWARGSLMTADPNETWDPRRDGMTVRATAIAVARPALRASPVPKYVPDGAPQGTPPVPFQSESDDHHAMLGLHPFALSLQYWTQLSPGSTWSNATISLDVTSGGSLLAATPEHSLRGYLVRPREVTSIGSAIIPAPPGDPLVTADLNPTLKAGYVAIYSSINGQDRVIGYGFCDATGTSSTLSFRQGIIAPGGGSTTDVKVWVAANGASAQIGPDTPAFSVSSDWELIFELNKQLAFGGDNNAPDHSVIYDYTRIRPGTLLAPALAR